MDLMKWNILDGISKILFVAVIAGFCVGGILTFLDAYSEGNVNDFRCFNRFGSDTYCVTGLPEYTVPVEINYYGEADIEFGSLIVGGLAGLYLLLRRFNILKRTHTIQKR